jgi:DNA (cytosine-5)-methyltransferase 1
MLKHLELFSGIGGFRQAIELLGKDHGLSSRCIGFSEIDKYASITYKSNFDTRNELEIGDIEAFTSDKKNIELTWKILSKLQLKKALFLQLLKNSFGS